MTTWIYTGDGDYLHGVPARDLTQDEYEAHRDAIERNAKATGKALYVESAPWVITDDIDTVDTVQEDSDDGLR